MRITKDGTPQMWDGERWIDPKSTPLAFGEGDKDGSAKG